MRYPRFIRHALPVLCAAAALLLAPAAPAAAQGGGCAAVAPAPAALRPALAAQREQDRAARRFARSWQCDDDFGPPRVRIVSGAGRGSLPTVTVRFTAEDDVALDTEPEVTLDGAPVLVQPAGSEGAAAAFAATVTLTPDRPHALRVSVWDGAGNRTLRRALLSYDLAGRMPVVHAGSYGAEPLNSSTGAAPSTDAYAGSASLSATAGTPDVLPNAGTTIERGLCLTISAGGGAASECGDLRLAHALPTARSYNQARTPVLLYNSQHAHPHPLVAAHVTIRAGAGTPGQVTVKLRVNGVQRAETTWPGSQFIPGVAQQVVVGFDGLDLATGVYPYTVEVTSWYAGTPYPSTAQGELAVVNRSGSPFGAGWWLAGWERLVYLGGTRMLWIGGDGSTRIYTQVASGDWTRWTAPAVDRPDTLYWGVDADLGNHGYWRKLPGGARVVYDVNGTHRFTFDRLKRRTAFTPDAATGALQALTLPIPQRSWSNDYSYFFTYGNPGGRLSAATLYAGSLTRTVQVGNLANGQGQVTSLTDPDSSTVTLGYTAGGPAGRRVLYRYDRRGTLVTYGYDLGARLTSAHVYMQGAGGDIVTAIVPQETRGLQGPPVRVDSAYTLLDGPRTDVADHTRFWVDRWGFVWKTRDALGHTTTAWRTDARFPALVTALETPNGLVTRAGYDARGNVDTTVVENPLGDGRNAVTRYTYGNAAWPDFATRVMGPDSVVSETSYDTLGNREWQQDGRGEVSRVTFGYNALGLVSAVKAPLAPAPDSLFYDRAGNLRATRTALGFWTLSYADALGRDTLVISPGDSASAARDTTLLKQAGNGVWERTEYDPAGRPLLTQSTGPETHYSRLNGGGYVYQAPQVLSVRNRYDRGGLLLRTDRWSTPDPAGIDTITTRWRYDPAGRKVAEIAPGAPGAAESKDSTVYDPAGNVTGAISRLGHQVAMQYDTLGRLRQRTIPATADVAGEVETFTYDEMGRLRSASNSAAVVRRGYARGGALVADTLHLADESGVLGALHVYVTAYQYDLAGRRKGMTVPGQVAPATGQRQFVYEYHRQTGALRSVTDPLGHGFTFAHRADGALDTLGLPGIVETYRYDGDGRMTHRRRGSPSDMPLYVDSLRYSPRGKTLQAITLRDSTRMVYDGLGHLAHSATYDWTSQGANQREEEYALDAMGNTLTHRRLNYSLTGSAAPQEPDTTVYTYQRWTGRHLTSIYAPEIRDYLSYGPRDDVFNQWDAAGNLRTRIDSSSVTLGLGATTTGQPGNTAPAVNDGTTNVMAVNGSDATHHYRADGKLMQTVRNAGCVLWIDDTNNTATCTNQVPDYLRQDRTESYRYDALGRRVYVRTSTPMGGWGQCVWRCDNTVRRTIWDGDQVLAEIRYPAEVADQDSGLDPANLQALAQKAETDTTPSGNPHGGPNTSDWAQHGRVLYVHAGGIDQPLGLIRMDYSFDFPGPTLVVPHANWRGAYELATFLGGGRTHCTSVWMPANEVVRMDSTGRMVYPADESAEDVYQTRCMEIDFPGKYMGMTRLLQRQTISGPIAWMGSLVQDAQDASGLMYRRNRFYDPKSGRFTQEDPIGLAGGVNVYGFAEGDPVSYDDPYGLCPSPPWACPAAVERMKDLLLTRAIQVAAVIGEVTGVSGLMRAFSGKDAAGNRVGAGERAFELGMAILGTAGNTPADDVLRFWAKGTFASAAESAAYHVGRHGGGKDLVEYTADARRFFLRNRHHARPHRLQTGEGGLKIVSDSGEGGIYTRGGKIVSYWYE